VRVLVMGASGMLGTDLLQEWKSDELIPASSRDADIRDSAQVRALIERHHPEWIVLAAAYSDVDNSERNRELAFAVNACGTENVVQAATEFGAKVLYISTDYVFDGKSGKPYEAEDPIAPLNAYGASKAAGERAVQKLSNGWCIARTSWLFGTSGVSFPEKILQASDTQPELTVVADQYGTPTFTRDLAVAIRDLIHANASNIVNVTNSGSCSWYEFAKEILRQAGRKTAVRPISTAEANRLAVRPAYSVLSTRSLQAYSLTLRPWQDALRVYLSELRERGKLVSA
jgi:dTDP-4-dehydrorhamnose reductase